MPEIISRRDGAIATLLFSNPAKLNAMSRDMWVQLAQGIEAADADPSVKVIVLRGEGERSFVSGADISQFGEMRNRSDTQAEYERAVAAGYNAQACCGGNSRHLHRRGAWAGSGLRCPHLLRRHGLSHAGRTHGSGLQPLRREAFRRHGRRGQYR